jgi:hypothetical protein
VTGSLSESHDHLLKIAEHVAGVHRIVVSRTPPLPDGHDAVARDDDQALTEITLRRERNRRALADHLAGGRILLELLVDLVNLPRVFSSSRNIEKSPGQN